MPSAIDLAKRALVSLLRTLAAAYGVALTLTRDAPDKDVSGAYRKVSLGAHPDRGGKAEYQTALNNAHDVWEAAKKARKPHGGKRDRKQQDRSGEAPVLLVRPEEDAQGRREGFRFQSKGVLLTYQKFSESTCWKRFVVFVKSRLASWKVRFWCATLETNHDGVEITYRENRNLKRDEWLREVKAGELFASAKKLQPGRHEGPRRLLRDNESFMGGKECRKE